MKKHWETYFLKDLSNSLAEVTSNLFERNKPNFDILELLTGPEFRKIFAEAYSEATKGSILNNFVVGTIAGSMTFGMSDIYTQKTVAQKVSELLPAKIQNNLQGKIELMTQKLKNEILQLLQDEFRMDSQDKKDNEAIKAINKEILKIIDKIMKFRVVSFVKKLGFSQFSSKVAMYLIKAFTEGATSSFLSNAFIVLNVAHSLYRNYTREDRIAQQIDKAIKESADSIKQSTNALYEELLQGLRQIQNMVYESIHERMLDHPAT